MSNNLNQSSPQNNNRIVCDDLEAQSGQFVRAVPITIAVPLANITGNPQHYEPSDRVVYVSEQNVPRRTQYCVSQQNGQQNFQQESSMKCCAICGCLFSWIPIVGLITYCVNLNAPRGSQTRIWASTAFCVSLVIIIINLLIWTMSSY